MILFFFIEKRAYLKELIPRSGKLVPKNRTITIGYSPISVGQQQQQQQQQQHTQQQQQHARQQHGGINQSNLHR